jgi:capsular exopolysaccharide synthesis family protein
MIFSFVTGILLACIVAAMLELTDNTFKTPQQTVDHLKLPALGSIPKRKLKSHQIFNGVNGNDEYFKSILQLSQQLSLLMREKKMKTLLITGVGESQETTLISANISICLAHNTGRRVLLFDADLRHSSLPACLNMINGRGLADILEGKATLEDVIQRHEDYLDILPAGSTKLNSDSLLDSHAMSSVISKIKDLFDIIIINCPNLKNSTDPAVLSSFADGTVVVINAGKVKREIYEIALEPLRQKQVTIVGTILNNYRYVIPEFIYRLA